VRTLRFYTGPRSIFRSPLFLQPQNTLYAPSRVHIRHKLTDIKISLPLSTFRLQEYRFIQDFSDGSPQRNRKMPPRAFFLSVSLCGLRGRREVLWSGSMETRMSAGSNEVRLPAPVPYTWTVRPGTRRISLLLTDCYDQSWARAFESVVKYMATRPANIVKATTRKAVRYACTGNLSPTFPYPSRMRPMTD
jgi:hypothetical protein